MNSRFISPTHAPPVCFGRADEPIIQSLLDLDVYKLFMGQFILAKHRGVKVKFALKLRTKGIRLADVVDLGALREELEHCRTLRLTSTERMALGGMHQYTPDRVLFQASYLNFMQKELTLAMPHIEALPNGDLMVEVDDDWESVTYWETIILSIVNELYYRSLTKDLTRLERDAILGAALVKLAEKIRYLKALRKEFVFTWSEFATRRRRSRVWQQCINGYFAEELGETFEEGFVGDKPFYRGTSCVRIALDNNVTPMGTMAHEMFMVRAALAGDDDQALFDSQMGFLEDWMDFYGPGLSMILSDTVGSDHIFKVMSPEFASKILGFRQDSDSPSVFFNKMLRFFERCGLDPRSKLGVPSDGLTLLENVRPILEEFAPRTDGSPGKTNISPGIGTDCSNDFIDHPALSLVMKAVSANGRPTVKLSDNPKKVTGPDDEVARYQRVFGYHAGLETETKY